METIILLLLLIGVLLLIIRLWFTIKKLKMIVSPIHDNIGECVQFPSIILVNGLSFDSYKHKVAFLGIAMSESFKQIHTGLIQTLQNEATSNFEFHTYVPSSCDEGGLHKSLGMIIHNKYDLLFCVGIAMTRVAKDVTLEQNMLTPVVFAAVQDPVKNNLIDSEQSSNNNLTGVCLVDFDYNKQIHFLHLLKPSVRTVLILYCPVYGALEYDKHQTLLALSRYNIIARIAVVQCGMHEETLFAYLTSIVDGIDALLTLRDPVIISYADVLINFCNKHGILFFSTNLDSVTQGAAVGYGIKEGDYGVEASGLVQGILENKKLPSELPIIHLQRRHKLRINILTMRMQGVEMTEEQLKTFKDIELQYTTI